MGGCGGGEGVQGEEAVAFLTDAAGVEEVGFLGLGGEVGGCVGG